MTILRTKLTISPSADVVRLSFTEPRLRTIRENVTTLTFTTNEFEAE
jgi:hypothetical protein